MSVMRLQSLAGICSYRRTDVVVRGWETWRSYHSSLIYLHNDHPEKDDSKNTPVRQQPAVFTGYNGLIDSAKQRTGMKNSEQFALALNEFLIREKHRKGHVAFIRIAMQRMDEFKLEKDLTTYNKILEIFPKGKYVPKRMIDAFWPRSTPQLELCLDLLTKMEEHGVRPSIETYDIVRAVFGKTMALEKCVRIMYLFDKYRDIDPYEIRAELPTNAVELSRLALFRMSGEDAQLTEIQVPKDDGDEGLIICGNSVKQLQHLEDLGHEDLSSTTLLHVEGPHRLWIKKKPQHYFTLRISEGKEVLSKAGGDLSNEGVVLGLCMCRPSTQESLQHWIGVLQGKYPSLSRVSILYDIEVERDKKDLDSHKQAKLDTS